MYHSNRMQTMYSNEREKKKKKQWKTTILSTFCKRSHNFLNSNSLE